jgi:hypothetical protein
METSGQHHVLAAPLPEWEVTWVLEQNLPLRSTCNLFYLLGIESRLLRRPVPSLFIMQTRMSWLMISERKGQLLPGVTARSILPWTRKEEWRQTSWLLTQRSRARFPALPDFLSRSGSGTGSTHPCENKLGATWKKFSDSGLENWD